MSANFAVSGTNSFRFFIEQDGNFYFKAIPDSTFVFGNGGGRTGYVTISGNVVAANFQEFDFATGSVVPGTPNFAGDPMLFGVGVFNAFLPAGAGVEADFDNISVDISPVPEPPALIVFGSVLLLMLGVEAARRALLGESLPEFLPQTQTIPAKLPVRPLCEVPYRC